MLNLWVIESTTGPVVRRALRKVANKACSSEAVPLSAIPRMAMKRQFSDDIVAAIRRSKGLRIRAGTGQHRFIGIWAVVVRDRVFVRSWSGKPNGWCRTFLKEPHGTIQLKDH